MAADIFLFFHFFHALSLLRDVVEPSHPLVLQIRQVCCSVLQCVAVCCSVLQYAVVWCSVWQCVAVCGSVLQFVVVQ